MKPICKTCNDTHRVLDDQEVPCPNCPVPCDNCRKGGNGPYCDETPCLCECHWNQLAYKGHTPIDSAKRTLNSLAADAMGYVSTTDRRGRSVYISREGVTIADWNPVGNYHQASQMLKPHNNWTITRMGELEDSNRHYEAVITVSRRPILSGIGHGPTMEHAITDAAVSLHQFKKFIEKEGHT